MIQDCQFETATQAVTPKKGSPWSGLGRGLTDEEWVALKEWRNQHPDLKWNHGEQREDGKIFRGYYPRCKNGESWMTAESWEKLINTHKAWASRPDVLRKARERKREKYNSDESFRKKSRDCSESWRVRNMERARKSRNEWKKKNRNNPKYREKQRLYQRQRREKILGKNASRSAAYRILGTTICHSDALQKRLIERMYRHAVVLTKIHKIEHHVDHIIPLHHGGLHAIGNLQILDYKTNGIKGSNPFWMSPDGLCLDWRDVPRHLWPENLRPEYERLIKLHPKPVHAIKVR